MEKFYSVLAQANLLYGLDLQEDDAIEIALIGWEKIGNKIHRLYNYTTRIDKNSLTVELPCNCDEIESVTYNFEDWQDVTGTSNSGDYNSQYTENYIEANKDYKSALYSSGKYAKYKRIGNTLYFEADYGTVHIKYKGYELDEEDLPYLTNKEVDALACYCAFVKKYKEGLATHNGAILQEAQLLEQRWLKLCDAARVPSYLNQNDMNQILDAKTRWGRKQYGKSYKPII